MSNPYRLPFKVLPGGVEGEYTPAGWLEREDIEAAFDGLGQYPRWARINVQSFA